MRVLFLTHNFPRHPGDVAGSFLLRLAHALRDQDVHVRVLAPGAEGLAARDVVDGVEVVRYRYAPRTFETLAYTGNMAADVGASWGARGALVGMLLAAARTTRRESRRERADVVHAHWWFPSGLSATMPGALGGLPLVVTSHGSDVRLARSTRPARPLVARVARRAAVWTFVSRWLRDEARAIAPIPDAEVIPMPVAAERFSPPDPSVPREGLLFVGRLNAQKGVADLVRAIARQRVEETVTIIGDGPERDMLRALAESLGVASRMRWVPTVKPDELPRYYARARALVIPSRGEGLGLVGVEAMLCETPVIAYASGGLTDVVRDGETGLLVEPGDLDALAAAMDRVAGDAPLARALGTRGRPDALAAFGAESVARRYREVYERAVASRRAAS
ncbi:glycosyl transferase group 1 [Gemmatirosa kalamazoonensis]|uniref:Glycosyl transferase group 1 n=1 Tax=Gemmatirosa kalamazoonensis TaxID=861299 RepID=W0RKE3_9BACT|nr:glycosyltransferase [Gemmatirosa kalamazoonensis]AHG90785.1 glycosyl transferase group 1 [Gemmatirosa kalamazoonensis]